MRLLNELLELSRIGAMNPPTGCAFRELVTKCCRFWMEDCKQPRTDWVADDPVVYGDRRRLLEVVQNLIDNAIKFSASQPSPLVEIGWDGFEDDKPIFFVRDNGIGILPEHHARIFDLFNKLDPMGEGTGVGLALVKRIIEFHGGRIWVESEAGSGAKFLFTLPGVEHPNPSLVSYGKLFIENCRENRSLCIPNYAIPCKIDNYPLSI
jgi:signal transduction histidine kinase